MKEVLLFLEQILKENKTIVIAISGGPDSMCLLHLLYQQKKEYNLKIIVAHVNHNLRKESKEEALFVKKVCDIYQIPFELKELNKPFVMVLNSNSPYTEECKVLAKEMEEKYQTQVIPMSCLDMTLDDLNNIFTKLLYEFVVERINIRLPKWVNGLSLDNSLKMDLFSKIKSTFKLLV